MDRTDFRKLLKRDLYPVLRAEGFRAAGTTLRRYEDPVVHVFNVQGSQYGRACYVNLGVHLVFLPTEGEGACDAATIKEYECAFRKRLGSSWPYGETPEEAEHVLGEMISLWRQDGRRYFERLAKHPDDFAAVVASGAAGEPHPLDCLRYARIALHLGMTAEGERLVQGGLARVGQLPNYFAGDSRRSRAAQHLSGPRVSTRDTSVVRPRLGR